MEKNKVISILKKNSEFYVDYVSNTYMEQSEGLRRVKISISWKKRKTNYCPDDSITAQRLQQENEILEFERGNDTNESPVNNVQEPSEHSAKKPEVQVPENTMKIPSFERKSWAEKWNL